MFKYYIAAPVEEAAHAPMPKDMVGQGGFRPETIPNEPIACTGAVVFEIADGVTQAVINDATHNVSGFPQAAPLGFVRLVPLEL